MRFAIDWRPDFGLRFGVGWTDSQYGLMTKAYETLIGGLSLIGPSLRD